MPETCGILVPWSEMEPRPAGSESRALPIGPPGNPHTLCLWINIFPSFGRASWKGGALTVKRLSTMRETRVQSLGWEDPLEKEIAIQSSTIAWKIPWAEEPGRLQSMGSQRVGHDWATSLHSLPHGSRFCAYDRCGLVRICSFYMLAETPAHTPPNTFLPENLSKPVKFYINSFLATAKNLPL